MAGSTVEYFPSGTTTTYFLYDLEHLQAKLVSNGTEKGELLVYWDWHTKRNKKGGVIKKK